MAGSHLPFFHPAVSFVFVTYLALGYWVCKWQHLRLLLENHPRVRRVRHLVILGTSLPASSGMTTPAAGVQTAQLCEGLRRQPEQLQTGWC